MKLVVLASCLAAVAVAAPQRFGRQFPRQNPAAPQQQFGRQFVQRDRQFIPDTRPDYRPIAILRDDRQDSGDGNFLYDFETENGIVVNADGAPGSRGQSNVRGSFRFPLPDGTYNEVRYYADENGYRAESPLIPTPHPLPAHAIEQIAFAEEQRRRGITWE